MTAMTSRNEAAERIDLLVDLYVSQSLRTLARKFGHEALAAERRATVDACREFIAGYPNAWLKQTKGRPALDRADLIAAFDEAFLP